MMMVGLTAAESLKSLYLCLLLYCYKHAHLMGLAAASCLKLRPSTISRLGWSGVE